MAEHTPTPWEIGDRKPYVEIWGPMRMNSSPILVSMEHEPREANAAFIVKAVNAHDTLVKALRNIEQRANESGTGALALIETIHALHRIAREALRAVEGETGKL